MEAGLLPTPTRATSTKESSKTSPEVEAGSEVADRSGLVTFVVEAREARPSPLSAEILTKGKI